MFVNDRFNCVWMFFVRDFLILLMMLLTRCGQRGIEICDRVVFGSLDRWYLYCCCLRFIYGFWSYIMLEIYDNSGWKDSITLFTLLYRRPLHYHCWIEYFNMDLFIFRFSNGYYWPTTICINDIESNLFDWSFPNYCCTANVEIHPGDIMKSI